MFSIVTGIIGWVTKACSKPPTSIMASVVFEGHEIKNRPEACNKMILSADFGPFIRAQPYLIGLLFGWILYNLKGKKIKVPHVSAIFSQYCNQTNNLIYVYIFTQHYYTRMTSPQYSI